MRPALLSLLAACAPVETPADTADSGGAETFDRWAPPDEVGPYGVAVRTLEWTDARGKEMKADVWYPAVVPDDAEKGFYEPFLPSLEVYRSLPLDTRGGPHPLAAFSHGMQAIRFQSATTLEYLASHGWVVVSPDHKYATPLDYDPDKQAQVIEERPGDMAAAVDGLVAWADAEGGDWAGAFDASRYAVMGHSLGSVTALVVAGGVADFQGVLDRCEEGVATRQACQLVEELDPALVAGTAGQDPRAEAVVPMSPGVWYAFGYDGEGLADLPPALLMAGTADPILSYDGEAVPTYDAIASDKTLASFEGAGHYLFSDMCTLLPPAAIETVTMECSGGEEWLPSEPAQAVSEAVLTAWLDVNFLGEERSTPWLTADGHGSPAFLTIESE